MNQILKNLKTEGWYINELKLTNYLKNEDIEPSYQNIKKILLNTDIKHYGESWINPSSKSEFQCFGVFQINKVRNVAAPEVDQDNKNNHPLLKFAITDGVSTVHLLDLQSNSKLNRNVDPGCKVIFTGQSSFKSGMVILMDKVNITCLGGKVLDLIRAEHISKSSKTDRFSGRGALNDPPKFTPFGNKLNINVQEIRNFKALPSSDNKDNIMGDNSDFGDKRQAAVDEIKKTKQDDINASTDKYSLLDKFHSGGTSKFLKETAEKRDQKDSNVAYLMSNGFSFFEVDKALKSSNGDVNGALDILLQKRTNSHLNILDKDNRGNRKRGRGKGRANEDEDDAWFDPAQYAAKVGLAVRPNTTTSLAELMGTKSSSDGRSDSQNSHFNANMIHRGFNCLAQIMDGSYQQAVVVDVLPNKCLKVKYIYNGEMIETNATSLKMVTGEKVLEHMVPNVPDPQLERHSTDYNSQSYNNYRGGSANRGRGQGNPNRRRGGRFHHGY